MQQFIVCTESQMSGRKAIPAERVLEMQEWYDDDENGDWVFAYTEITWMDPKRSSASKLCVEEPISKLLESEKEGDSQ